MPGSQQQKKGVWAWILKKKQKTIKQVGRCMFYKAQQAKR
jgi:hypothetical protein